MDDLLRAAGDRADIIRKVTRRLIPLVGICYLVAQNAVPWIRDATDSTIAPMLFLAACLAVGGLMTFLVQAAIRRRPRPVAVTA